MQAPCSRIRCIGPIERFGIVGINHEQLGRLDQREVRVLRIDQELRSIVVDGEGLVVRYRLVHAEPRGPAETRGKLHALFPERKV